MEPGWAVGVIEVREVKKREEKGKCPKDECCGATNVLARMPLTYAARKVKIDRVEISFDFG